MMKISVHFSLKNGGIETKEKQLSEIAELFKEKDVEVQHCFLPREILEQKNIPTTVVDRLEDLFPGNICRYTTPENLEEDRLSMLRDVKDSGGYAVFIVANNDFTADKEADNYAFGLEQEYISAIKLKCNIIEMQV